MAKGMTLWEMLVERLSPPVETLFHNPLKAKVGSPISVDTVELRDMNFLVREIREYRRKIGSQEFLFVDYVLLARPLGGQDVWARLRLNPVDDPERAAGITHQALWLTLYDDLAYNEDLHRVVNDTTRKFEVNEEGQVTEEYWRINDVSTPYKAQVAVVKDADRDGLAEKDEVERFALEFWDYWRDTKDDTGVAFTQFLFIEMDGRNGWFQLWRGQEIDPQKVLVL